MDFLHSLVFTMEKKYDRDYKTKWAKSTNQSQFD